MRVWQRAGIEPIIIPYTVKDVSNTENYKDIIPLVLKVHRRNAKKIDKLLKYVDGTDQPIDKKQRKFENQSEHNNRVKENHAFAIVNFKEGFLLGQKREFAQKSKSETDQDDLVFFDRYLTDVAFYGKDVDVKHNIYATGIGIDLVQPRTDIFATLESDQSRYKTKEEGYDIENDSPFIYESLDCRFNGIVFTSLIGQQGLGDLFDFNISKVIEKGYQKEVLTVYTRDWTAQFDTSGELIPSTLKKTPPTYRELPMTLHIINKAQEGVVEPVYDMLNSINTITSNSIDNIVDRTNQIIVVKNCDFDDDDTVSDMLAGGVVILPSNNMVQADLDTVSIDLGLADVNVTYEQVLTQAYDIVGVPLATANVTSGGDTGQARLLGAGWTNAYSIINRDIRYMEQGDIEVLRKMIKICKANKDSKINDVTANQIDIKYNINLSDNILSKTQAMSNLYSIDFPLEHILKAVPLVADTKTVAIDWQKNIDGKRETENNGFNQGDNFDLSNTTQRSVQTQDVTEKS